MPSWKEATAVRKLGASTYECTLHDDWCIGSGKLYAIITTADHAHLRQFPMADT
jgi:hypothetical protein